MAAHYFRSMPDEINNLVLDHLRAIRVDLGQVRNGVHNLQVRVTSIEENMAAMNRRLDNMDRRIECIEKRLGLVEV